MLQQFPKIWVPNLAIFPSSSFPPCYHLIKRTYTYMPETRRDLRACTGWGEVLLVEGTWMGKATQALVKVSVISHDRSCASFTVLMTLSDDAPGIINQSKRTTRSEIVWMSLTSRCRGTTAVRSKQYPYFLCARAIAKQN